MPAEDTVAAGGEEKVSVSLLILQRLDRIETRMDRIDTEMRAGFERLDAKIDAVRKELDGKIERVGAELDGKIERVGGRLDSVVRWAVTTFIAVLVLSVGLASLILTQH